ncbi:MAG: SulP family inorganic anion transporter [Candidatus Woesearchaeota archaeon]|nr:SulP family inorganic anion transporter [Candidatus Woesearchaeota archaeon]
MDLKNIMPDIKAGFITSIVALPLAIAFAIASGLEPIFGLYTAIIGGILASSIAGSKFSITGPTGAMAVVILVVVNKYGLTGLLLAGFLAGLIQLILGLVGLGKAVSYIPIPVISGFTAGIGAIIFIGQIANSLGITVPSHEFIGDTLKGIIDSAGGVQLAAVAITLMTIALLVYLPSLLKKSPFFRNIPASIFPLIISVLVIILFNPNIPIIGQIPRGLPQIHLFPITFRLVKDIFPSAFTIALLGSIEALLCAVVCDGMTATKHNPNKELVAQGITNMVVPFFGGMPVTAAIARSAVNIREGAKTNMAGVIHGIFLLAYMLFFGSLIALVPKAFLAGVLMVVSIRMINIHEIKTIFSISRGEALVFSATFLLTVFTDLVFAVQAGMIMVSFLLFYRLTTTAEVETMSDHDKNSSWIKNHIESDPYLKKNVSVYTIYGAFFFGAMTIFEKKIVEHVDVGKPILLLRMRYVPFIDSSAIIRLKELFEERKKEGKLTYLIRVNSDIKKRMHSNEAMAKILTKDMFFDSTKAALEKITKTKPI